MKLAIVMRWTNLIVQKPRKFWTSKPNSYLALQPDDIVLFFVFNFFVGVVYLPLQGSTRPFSHAARVTEVAINCLHILDCFACLCCDTPASECSYSNACACLLGTTR